MSRDGLDDLTRALRDEHSPDAAADGELGRRRLERALARSTRPRRRTHVYLLLAASFVGITAWAGTTGRIPRVTHLLDSIAPADHAGEHDERGPVAAGSGLVATPATPPPASAPLAEVPEASASIAAPVETAERVAPPPRPRPSASTAPPAPTLAAPSAPDPDTLYREASAAQFERKDWSAALAGWDRYLAAAGPSGRFTVEARWNRAIALLRLGRRDEARSALEPFARGEWGGYRKDDATRLLESLR